MKAVVVHGAGDLRIDQLPDPTPGPGEVLIAMEWGGICGKFRNHCSLLQLREAPLDTPSTEWL